MLNTLRDRDVHGDHRRCGTADIRILGDGDPGHRQLFAVTADPGALHGYQLQLSLGISERTVKTHLGHLFERPGVTSRTEAVKVATRRRLVRLG